MRSLARSGGAQAAEGFFSNFSGTEAVLSEGGIWLTNDALDWTIFKKDNGRAYATHAGTTDFKDSYAYVNPAVLAFGPNQRVKIVLFKSSTPTGFTEYEILLRVVTTVSPRTVTLVECNLAKDGQYQEVIGWKGPLGTNGGADFEFYSSGNPVSGGVNDGDIFEAQIVGTVVSTFYNGVPHVTVDIAGGIVPHTVGQPGIGGFTTSGDANEMAKIGMRYFQARTL